MARSRIRVALAIPTLSGWGAERFLINLANGLNRRQFEPMLILSTATGPLRGEIGQDIAVYDLGRKSRYSFPKLVFRLARVLQKERPEIIFSNLFHSNILSVLARSVARIPIKVIIRQANAWPQYKDDLLMRVLMAKIYPLADLVIAPSQGIRGNLLRDFRIPPGKIRTIYNPVDTDTILRLSAEKVPGDLGNGVPVIACTSRLEHQKGIHYLIEAFATIRRQMKAKLLLIGDGTLRKTLEGMVEALNVKHDVLFVGYQPNPFKWIKHATVFVLPSLYEGFPNALLEALALGLPVVSAACPHGPTEILEEGKTGLLVPPADAPALAYALIRVLKDETLRTKLSEAARRRAAWFSAERWFGMYEQLFCEMVGASHPEPTLREGL